MSITTKTANVRLLTASLLGGLGVSLGAFGSHAFLNRMDVNQKRIYDVANQYQLLHAVVMALVAVAGQLAGERGGRQAKLFDRAYLLFLSGTVVVATTRYVHCVVHKPEWLDKLAPVGGLLLAAGWGCVMAAGFA